MDLLPNGIYEILIKSVEFKTIKNTFKSFILINCGVKSEKFEDKTIYYFLRDEKSKDEFCKICCICKENIEKAVGKKLKAEIFIEKGLTISVNKIKGFENELV